MFNGSADNDGVYADGKLTWKKTVAKDTTLKVTFQVKVNDDVNGKAIENTGHVDDGLQKIDTNPTHNPTPKKNQSKMSWILRALALMVKK